MGSLIVRDDEEHKRKRKSSPPQIFVLRNWTRSKEERIVKILHETLERIIEIRHETLAPIVNIAVPSHYRRTSRPSIRCAVAASLVNPSLFSTYLIFHNPLLFFWGAGVDSMS